MSSKPASSINHRFADPNAYTGDLPPDWDARRKTTYRRDDWTCQHCGTQSGPHASNDGVRLHAHHVTPRSEGGSNDLGNLITLCEECHQAVHDHNIFGDGWQGDQSPSPIFGATRDGWAIAAVTALAGSYFVYIFGTSVNLFGGLVGGSFFGAIIALYLCVLLVTVWKPLYAIGGYGLLGVLFVAYINSTGQSATAPEPMISLLLSFGPLVLLVGALALRKLRR